jgi:hypothetical protein
VGSRASVKCARPRRQALASVATCRTELHLTALSMTEPQMTGAACFAAGSWRR